MMKSLLLTLGLCTTLLCSAQTRRMNAPIVSPEVHPDQTVTFRYSAPNATRVELAGDFLSQNLPMTKNDKDVWEITTQAIEPDVYGYNFVVNGSISVADPANVEMVANEGFKRSLVELPGKTPQVYAMQNVPHGQVTYCFYSSKTLGHTRPLVVYTPAGYDPNGSVTYPVLYLLHGASDTHETWYKVGRLNLIMDNLIAQGKAAKMIVVMPYANPNKRWGQPSIAEAAAPRSMGSNLFTKELLDDIIPYVEANYKVKANRDNRAIAGFSRGGGQTLAAGLGHPEVFGSVCGYSPAVGGLDESFKNIYAPIDQLKGLKYLSLSVGKSDFLYQSTVALSERLTKEGVKHETLYTEGGHNWINCKRFITNSVQVLFK